MGGAQHASTKGFTYCKFFFLRGKNIPQEQAPGFQGSSWLSGVKGWSRLKTPLVPGGFEACSWPAARRTSGGQGQYPWECAQAGPPGADAMGGAEHASTKSPTCWKVFSRGKKIPQEQAAGIVRSLWPAVVKGWNRLMTPLVPGGFEACAWPAAIRTSGGQGQYPLE